MQSDDVTMTPVRGERRWWRIGAIVLAAAVVGVVVWLLVRPGSEPTPQAASTAALSDTKLRALAGALARPFFWVGPQRGVTYEFTQAPDGRTYVRYLPKGAQAGTTQAYLTVATYPVANALAVTRAAARRAGSVSIPVAGGAVAFFAKDRPTNVYVAFPGSSAQIELYDPSAGSLRRLVAAGRVQQVERTSGTATQPQASAVAATEQDIKALSAKLARPIYWLGPRAGMTYELTTTPDGRVYVRYLPAGAAIGTTTPYLTVATYPLKDALAATKRAARAPGTVRIPLPGGGAAFYSKAHPTSAYVAFPGVDDQIEVFDPSARRAHRIVAAHRVRAVS